jgi:hypothetical protein
MQRVVIGAEFGVLTLGLSPRFVCLRLFGAGDLDGLTVPAHLGWRPKALLEVYPGVTDGAFVSAKLGKM